MFQYNVTLELPSENKVLLKLFILYIPFSYYVNMGIHNDNESICVIW